MVLTQPYTAEEVSLQSYALIRRYTEWKSERKEEIPVMVGKLKILPLQRTVEWEHKRIPVVKREFDFLYLLATTPGRVYTYSQIYQLVWQEYPHGDITNIIYCMVHRLKQKLNTLSVTIGWNNESKQSAINRRMLFKKQHYCPCESITIWIA